MKDIEDAFQKIYWPPTWTGAIVGAVVLGFATALTFPLIMPYAFGGSESLMVLICKAPEGALMGGVKNGGHTKGATEALQEGRDNLFSGGAA